MKFPRRRSTYWRESEAETTAEYASSSDLIGWMPERSDQLDGGEGYHPAMLPAACFLGECCHRKSSLQRQLELPPLNRKAQDALLEEVSLFLGDSPVLYKHSGCAHIQDSVTALHQVCAATDPRVGLEELCRLHPQLVPAQNGAGQTPLHVLLLNHSRCPRWPVLHECCQILLAAGAPLDIVDQDGDTPLLYLRSFLSSGHAPMAARLAEVLLAAGAVPDAVNSRSSSLLMYSVERLDEAAALTRTLINAGAHVRATPRASAFSSLLRGVVSRRCLEDCDVTVELVCRQLAEQPHQMRAHVLSAMVSQGENFRLIGPVFLALKQRLRRYWSQPAQLRHLSCEVVRRSLQAGAGILAGVKRLQIPPSCRRAIMLEDTT